MGGDDAPDMVISGLSEACLRYPKVKFLVFGQSDKIKPLIESHKDLALKVEIVHAQDVISSKDKPSAVIRTSKNTSMRMAIEAVSEGRADGVVSAGNTGAYMALSKLILKSMPGIDRPAIATVLPTKKGDVVMLDLGANIECDANNLMQFAVMGTIFARNVLGLTRPKVGLLNVGAEDLKGNTVVKAAAEILKEAKDIINFYGFVEGNDIFTGKVDVVVTDGFTGNVALKTIEGCADMIMGFLKLTFKSTFMAKIGYLFAAPALNRLKYQIDPRQYNGASFLGLNHVAIKSHGGTDAVGFANAISVAVEIIEQGFTKKVAQELEQLQSVVDLTKNVSLKN